MIAIGIDCTSGKQAFTVAVLDRDLRVVSLAEQEMDDLIQGPQSWDAAAIAINAPSRINAGVVRRRLEAARATSAALRGVDLREAEHELRERGIPIAATPRSAALCPGWIQLGFSLHARIAEAGFRPYPSNDAPRQWLETHPHAGFTSLLERPPLARPTLEGRLQRALVLFERGVRIHDPMAFLEEITRHRLIHGLLPWELVLAQEQLDALLAAYTAWLTLFRPAEVSQLGNAEEGFITLPVPQLQQKYPAA